MAKLDIRPNCECCNKDLSPSDEAYICSYECTFCRECTLGILAKYCPNCLGDLQRRPTRPYAGPVGGLRKHPVSKERVIKNGGCVATPDPSRSGEIWNEQNK